MEIKGMVGLTNFVTLYFKARQLGLFLDKNEKTNPKTITGYEKVLGYRNCPNSFRKVLEKMVKIGILVRVGSQGVYPTYLIDEGKYLEYFKKIKIVKLFWLINWLNMQTLPDYNDWFGLDEETFRKYGVNPKRWA